MEKKNIEKRKYIIGAIAGDVIGSVYEWHNVKRLEFDLFCPESTCTVDSVCTLATMEALMNQTGYVRAYQDFGRKYPHRGYGGSFKRAA